MKKQNPGSVEIFRIAGKRFAALLFLMAFLETAHAGPYFWDPQGVAGPSDGSGNWDDQSVSNWWAGSLTTWTNLPANPNGGNGTNAIIGAGVPGTYYITNINPVVADTLTFSNAGSYTITGNQLGVDTPSSFNGPVLISLSNTTNTITANGSGNLGLVMNQGNDISNAPGSVLTLASGVYEYGGNPRFEGISQSNSTVNLTGGTVNDSTSSSTFQITGITMNITNAIFDAVARLDIARNAVQSSTQAATTINVYNGGQLNANTKAGNNSGNHMQLTRTGGETILNVFPGGLVTTLAYSGITTPNSSPAGNVRILPDSGGQATLNVLGGTVLAGDGVNFYGGAGSYNDFLTEITFFDSAPTLNASSRAILNMTGGSVTAYEIAFSAPGGISTGPTNGINITGGTLYLGTPNIAYPAGGLGANFLFNLSGGTIAAIQNWSPACSAPINLTNVNGNVTFQTADINGTPYDLAFSGPLTGVGGFNLIGGGTLTLSGANNYSGATVVSNGTLAVQTPNAPASGSVTLEGAGLGAGFPTNSIQPSGGGRSWTVNGNLTYDTGLPTADFNFGTFAPSTTVPAIQVNGNLNFNVTPQVTLEGTAVPKGSYPLIQYTGTLSGTPPSTVILSGSATSGYIENNTATKTIDLVITASTVVSPIAWATGSGIWDTGSLNWEANGATVAYSDPDPVEFNDSATGPFPISVSVAGGLVVHPESIMVSAANSYAITGPGSIGGNGNLTKSGAGTLTLSGTNTYSGGTTVDGGILNINYGGNGVNNSAIGTGPLTLNTGAQLGNSSGQPITMLTPITQNWNGDSLTFIGTNNLDLGTGPVTLGSALVQLDVVTNTVEVDGQISDGGLAYGIEKLGNGSLTLSNVNTFSGNMEVAGGTLNINNAGAVGSGTLILEDSAAIDNQSGAPITITSLNAITMSSFTFLGTTNLDLGSATIQVIGGTVNVSNNTLTVDGSLNGANTTITKNGPGALTIDGSGTSGSVSYTINAGTLNADRGPGTPSFGVQQTITINTNGELLVLSPTGDQFDLNTLTLNGGLVELNGDNGETLNGINFNSGILSDSSPTAVQLNLTPGYFVTLGGTADFGITNGASLTINGIVNGTNSQAVLLKTGAGTLTLSTNMSYVGNTTVSNGTLSITYPNLPNNGTVTIEANAVLDLDFTNYATNVVGGLVLNGAAAAAGIHNASTDPTYISGIGTLLVVPPIVINPNPGPIQFKLSGTTLNLAWPTNAGWFLQVQTNSVRTGISNNWVTVPGSDSITNLSVGVDPANGATFYRLMYNP